MSWKPGKDRHANGDCYPEQLRPLGVPEEAPRGEKNQHEIRIPVQFREGEAVDAIGYLDFWYPKLGPNGTVIDLKTTAKLHLLVAGSWNPGVDLPESHAPQNRRNRK